ncbi:F-box domain [Dillenia turbinata]|uniref:F-box protein GID2 n=1 Tax=Dillenia turbinata TaxID=194707 RepID=A0AAN8V320_9MAGN
MKRTLDLEIEGNEVSVKKTRNDVVEEGHVTPEMGFVNLDEDLLYEVLRHVDARTLATAACVSKQWRKTAHDERLWELICTSHWVNIGCGKEQLRSVVLALGGFRRLHALCLRLLMKAQPPRNTTSSCPVSSDSPALSPGKIIRWGRDEVNLSLSLLSIRYYEKMNFNNHNNRPR